MRIVEVDRIRRKIKREFEACDSPLGTRIPCKWVVKDETGGQRTIHYLDIRGPVEWKDNFDNLIHWIGVLKNHLRERMKADGQDTRLVKQHINRSFELMLCLDLDNSDKHAGTDRSW